MRETWKKGVGKYGVGVRSCVGVYGRDVEECMG